MGVIVADAGEGEGLVTCDVDLQRIERVREALPSLSSRRADLY